MSALPIPGLIHLNLKLSPWWFSCGDCILVISLWWFWDQLTLLTISCRTHLVPPIFSYGILAFHAPGILFLSFLTVMSFLTTTRLSTMSLGPLLDAPDRCVGWLKPEVIEGETAPCARKLLLFPHDVLLLPLVVALLLLAFRALDPQSLWWRREWRITSVACLTTADPLLVVLPTTF